MHHPHVYVVDGDKGWMLCFLLYLIDSKMASNHSSSYSPFNLCLLLSTGFEFYKWESYGLPLKFYVRYTLPSRD